MTLATDKTHSYIDILGLSASKITLTTKEFHALIKALKSYDHKKWDEGSLILAAQELKL
jgi:hypothetical protein